MSKTCLTAFTDLTKGLCAYVAAGNYSSLRTSPPPPSRDPGRDYTVERIVSVLRYFARFYPPPLAHFSKTLLVSVRVFLIVKRVLIRCSVTVKVVTPWGGKVEHMASRHTFDARLEKSMSSRHVMSKGVFIFESRKKLCETNGESLSFHAYRRESF